MNLNHLLLSMLLASINYIYNSCLSNLCLKTSDTRDSTISPSDLLQGCAILTIRKYFPVTYLDLDRGRWSQLPCFLYTTEAESRLFAFLPQPFECLLPCTQSFCCLRLKDSSLLCLFLQTISSRLVIILVALLQAVSTCIDVLKMQKCIPVVAWQILQDVFINVFAFFTTYPTPVCLLIQCNLQVLSVLLPLPCFYCWLFKFMYNFMSLTVQKGHWILPKLFYF